MTVLRLSGRSLVAVSGDDAQSLLQGVLTTDIEGLPADEARAGALLTPQGKILFDFLISRAGDSGFLLDVERENASGLAKRLTLYKLRAKVEIAERPGMAVAAVWNETPAAGALTDTRFRAGTPVYRRYESNPAASVDEAAAEAYDSLRIDAGVAESGRDFALSDVFPHDVLFDLNDGVSFRKGCFVGQEVVSRMHHRKSARKRIVRVEGSAGLPASGAPLEAGGRSIGTLGTVVGSHGLALARTDRVADALADGLAITAGGVTVSVSLPEWTGLSFEQKAAAE